jgi:hypothetical protein
MLVSEHAFYSDLDNKVCYECGDDWSVVDCVVSHDDCITVECVKCDTWESTCYGGKD